MEKSPDAFRTISEVAELLETPAHVLRFWESRFPQVRPVKRAGGRRYYRPSDVALLSGIKRLLHSEGLTIRGVQKVLREQGIRHVMTLADHPIAEDSLIYASDEPADLIQKTLRDAEAETEAPPSTSVLILGQPAMPKDQLPRTDADDESSAATTAPDTNESAPVPAIGSASQPRAEGPPADVLPSVAAEITTSAPTDTVPVGTLIETPADPSGPVDDMAEVEWIPTRLRTLTQVRSAHQRHELARFHGDLVTLRARLAETAQGQSR